MVDLSPLKQKPQAENTPKTDENYWVNVLLYFASFLVGLGIIAEVAYNWNELTNAVKMVGAVCALVANAGALVWCVTHQKMILKHVIATIFAFLIMGVIGLIGQVFQLQPNPASACLLWSAVSWPILYFVPNLLWLWLPLFFVGMRFQATIIHEIAGEFIGVIDAPSDVATQILALGDVYWYVVSAICLYGYFIAYTLWVNSARPNKELITKPLRFYSGILMLSIYAGIVALVHYHPLKAENLAMYARVFTPYLVMAVLIFAINRVKKRVSFLPLFFVGTIFEALLMEQQNSRWFQYSLESVIPGVYVMLMLFYAYYHKMPRFKMFMTIVALIWAIAMFQDNIFDIIPSLIFCAVCAFGAYKTQSRKGFNTAVILAVVRILIYYADVENLQFMGLYLIGSGLLIIVTVLGLTKYAPLLWRNQNE